MTGTALCALVPVFSTATSVIAPGIGVTTTGVVTTGDVWLGLFGEVGDEAPGIMVLGLLVDETTAVSVGEVAVAVVVPGVFAVTTSFVIAGRSAAFVVWLELLSDP